jgi:hypothetical protein
MNIFFLDKCTQTCAEMHLDKHVVKMILEYAQLLSTAHRILDGSEYIDKTANGRNIKRWKLEDKELEPLLFKASHINHPSAKWVRESKANYRWLASLLCNLCLEYTHRYKKVHSVERSGLAEVLRNNFPQNFPHHKTGDLLRTDPPPAMPDECKIKGDSIASYKKYYIEKKAHFARWTNREVPKWFLMNTV